MSTHKSLDFETVFTSFQSAVHPTPFPSKHNVEQKVFKSLGQQFAITSTNGFAFGMLVDVVTDTLSPIEKVPFPFHKNAVPNRQFCRFVHPAYLLPYLLFVRYSYEVVNTVKGGQHNALTASYRMPIPLLLPHCQRYAWYILKAQTVSINERGAITCHANFYEYDRDCLMLANGDIENRFIEPSLLLNNQLHLPFQNCLRFHIKQHFASLFQKQYKQGKMLDLLKQNRKQSNASLAATLKLTEETIKSYNKEILYKLKTNLGYQFVTIREAVTALSVIGYL